MLSGVGSFVGSPFRKRSGKTWYQMARRVQSGTSVVDWAAAGATRVVATIATEIVRMGAGLGGSAKVSRRACNAKALASVKERSFTLTRVMSRLARLIGNTNTNPGRGAWLALGIGIGTAVGVLTGSLFVGLGVGAIAGVAVAARGSS
jgi:hypothetical protein